MEYPWNHWWVCLVWLNLFKDSFEFLTKVSNGHKVCLVGYNIVKFDLPLLHEELKREHGNYEAKRVLLSAAQHYIDTITIVKDEEAWSSCNLQMPEEFSLESVYRHLFDHELLGSHTAVGDVKATLDILLKLDPSLKFAMKYLMSGNVSATKVKDKR